MTFPTMAILGLLVYIVILIVVIVDQGRRIGELEGELKRLEQEVGIR